MRQYYGIFVSLFIKHIKNYIHHWVKLLSCICKNKCKRFSHTVEEVISILLIDFISIWIDFMEEKKNKIRNMKILFFFCKYCLLLLHHHHHFDVEIKFNSGCISDLKIKLTCFIEHLPTHLPLLSPLLYSNNEKKKEKAIRKTNENVKRDKSIWIYTWIISLLFAFSINLCGKLSKSKEKVEEDDLLMRMMKCNEKHLYAHTHTK